MLDIPKTLLKNLYTRKGLTTYEVAKQLGCSQGAIWNRLREYNIPSRYRQPIQIPKNKLEKWYLVDLLSTWEIEKRYGYSRSTVYRNLVENDIKPRSLAMSHVLYDRMDFAGSKSEKAYLIGFAMGDLRVRRTTPNGNTVHIDCGSTKPSQIKLIKSLFKNYGRVWVSKPNKRGAVQIECFVNLSFNFLLRKRKLADRWIVDNKKYFAAFLAGFTDAEGCVSINKSGRAYYSLGNNNFRLLRQIRSRLIGSGIKVTALINHHNRGNVVWGKYRQNEDYHSIGVHQKFSLLKLFDLIWPYTKHEDKKLAIKKARSNINYRNRVYGNLRM